MTTQGPEWNNAPQEPPQGWNNQPPLPPQQPPVGYSPYGNAAPPPNRGWVKWVVIAVVAVLVLVVGGVVIVAVANHNDNKSPGPISTSHVVVPGPGPVTTTPDNGGIVTTPPADTSKASSQDEQTYVQAERASGKFSTSTTDESLLTVGYDICDVFRAGGTLQTVASTATGAGLSSDQTAYLVAGSVLYLCPDQKDKIPNN